MSSGTIKSAIVVDGEYLYWSDYAGSTIKRRRYNGTGPTTTLISGPRSYELEIEGDYLYYVNALDNTLCRIAKTGGAVTILATGALNNRGLEIGPDYIYLANIFDEVIYRVPKAGGVLETFISGYGTGIVGRRNDKLVWLDYLDGYFYRANLSDGSDIEVIASGLDQVTGGIFHGAWVYLVQSGAGKISRMPADGGAVTDVVTGLGADIPYGVDFIGNTMVWSMADSGNLMGFDFIEDDYGQPLLSLFSCADHISPQTDGHYTVYGPAAGRKHWHSVLCWKQATNIYAIFGKAAAVNAVGTGLMNLIAYCNQTVHAWRAFRYSGTDSAIDPMTGLPYGAFTNRFRVFPEQAPHPVSPGVPWVYGTETITSITPAVSSTCGPVDMVSTAGGSADGGDLPEESA